MKSWILHFWLVVFVLAMTCCDDKGTSEDGDGANAKYLVASCPKLSVCLGETVNSCFGVLDGNILGLDGSYMRHYIINRARCLEEAQSCAEVESCVQNMEQKTFEEMLAIETDIECGEKEEVICKDGVAVWCYMGEYDEVASPAEVMELDELGKTCNSQGTHIVDPGGAPCENDPKDTDGIAHTVSCDGTRLVECFNGERVTWDCADVDPSFTCVLEYGQARCRAGKEKSDCEMNTFNNHGDSARCDGSIAVVCAGGKTFDVDCSVFGGASCVERDEYDALCTK
jgi:hypothetical protein